MQITETHSHMLFYGGLSITAKYMETDYSGFISRIEMGVFISFFGQLDIYKFQKLLLHFIKESNGILKLIDTCENSNDKLIFFS